MWKYFLNCKAPCKCNTTITKYVKGIRQQSLSQEKQNGRTWSWMQAAGSRIKFSISQIKYILLTFRFSLFLPQCPKTEIVVKHWILIFQKQPEATQLGSEEENKSNNFQVQKSSKIHPSVNWSTKLGALQIRKSMLYLCVTHILILLLYFSLGVEKTEYVDITWKVFFWIFTWRRWQGRGKRERFGWTEKKRAKKKVNNKKKKKPTEQ